MEDIRYIEAWIARDKKDNDGKKTNQAYLYFRGEPFKDEKKGQWSNSLSNDAMKIDDGLFDYAVNPQWSDKRATKIKLEVHKFDRNEFCVIGNDNTFYAFYFDSADASVRFYDAVSNLYDSVEPMQVKLNYIYGVVTIPVELVDSKKMKTIKKVLRDKFDWNDEQLKF